ncbi:hypothetical protein [Halococcus sp. IIIV-5B]|uniref:hypothetical protein n=1 Tax=Halococcus sp. IIIV-5B TaxID=2321230 RepID=UPI000E752049|nr:hypothetical protein [Halococcus sp. IIIV-5B]RJT07940.1 hypothetical protein D3261_00905 [Halococcus sp. IIIV-5B]
MVILIERAPTERLYMWAGLTALIGFSITVSSVASLLVGAGSPSDWLLIIAGVSMLVGTAWEIRHRDPATFSPGVLWLGFLVICTIVTVAFSALTVLGLF